MKTNFTAAIGQKLGQKKSRHGRSRKDGREIYFARRRFTPGAIFLKKSTRFLVLIGSREVCCASFNWRHLKVQTRGIKNFGGQLLRSSLAYFFRTTLTWRHEKQKFRGNLRWRHRRQKFRRKLSLRPKSRPKKVATFFGRPRKDCPEIYFARRRFAPGAP